MNDKANELRAAAAKADQEAHDSFERCDTDGFLSQWASGLTAQLYRLQAQVEENGGKWEFPTLTDVASGQELDAKMIDGKYGLCWRIRKADGTTAFSPVADVAQDGQECDEHGYTLKSQAKLARRGYRQVLTWKPAKAIMTGTGRGLSGRAWPIVIERKAGE